MEENTHHPGFPRQGLLDRNAFYRRTGLLILQRPGSGWFFVPARMFLYLTASLAKIALRNQLDKHQVQG